MKKENVEREDKEICNECGESVAKGSGRFTNRIPSFDDETTQKDMGKPYPKGEFMCIECENAYYEKNRVDHEGG